MSKSEGLLVGHEAELNEKIQKALAAIESNLKDTKSWQKEIGADGTSCVTYV
jgi:hypothetical protein